MLTQMIAPTNAVSSAKTYPLYFVGKLGESVLTYATANEARAAAGAMASVSGEPVEIRISHVEDSKRLKVFLTMTPRMGHQARAARKRKLASLRSNIAKLREGSPK